MIFQCLKNHVTWNQLIVHWHTYKKKHHETFYVPEEESPNKNEDGDEILHDDEWALEDEEEPVHINKPPSDINNHYNGGMTIVISKQKQEDQPYLWHENYYIVEAICCYL